MTYLDYSASTPMSLDAIDSYVKCAKEYYGAISANNGMGIKVKEALKATTNEISNLFNILDKEIIYTSGATEANNMALIGAALANHKRGKHIIVSRLEHSSIYTICEYLESIGFEISYVQNDEEGLVSFDDLKHLIREDTILVSICAVNHETGIRQPLKMLRQIIKKENEFTIFHSDLSQALGKTAINFKDIDLGSVSAHKVYGPKGIGFLYKNSIVKISPLLYGNNKNPLFKPGEISLPLIVSMKDAIKSALKDLDKKERYVTILNERVVDELSKIDGIIINKTKYSIPHIVNISVDNVKAEVVLHALEEKEIYIEFEKADSEMEIRDCLLKYITIECECECDVNFGLAGGITQYSTQEEIALKLGRPVLNNKNAMAHLVYRKGTVAFSYLLS